MTVEQVMFTLHLTDEEWDALPAKVQAKLQASLSGLPVETEPKGHTPGPWLITGDSQGVHITANNGDTQIALMCATDTMEQVLPDAHLMASAPEMIIALELVAREHKAKGRVCTCENLPYPCTLCAVNTAISNSKPA